MTEAAWAAVHSKQGYLRDRYYALCKRIGSKKALVAIGHKILCAAYFILKYKQPYQSPNEERYRQIQKEKALAVYTQKLKALGYRIEPQSC